MATILSLSASSSLSSISLTRSNLSTPPSSSSSSFVHFRSFDCRFTTIQSLPWRRSRREIATAAAVVAGEEPATDQIPLTMLFQAEGTMKEAAILTVTKALKETEGISNLKVQIVEGIASVELTKEMTSQDTGVSSNLVEIIQGSGFTLQTLKLSFEDEEDI